MIERGQPRAEVCLASVLLCLTACMQACHYVHGVYDAMNFLWVSLNCSAIFRGAQGRGCSQRDRENIYFIL